MRITTKLVGMDSRSHQGNVEILEAALAELAGFAIERLDYIDEAGATKRVAVARNRPGPCVALCGHVDTVPDLGWKHDPFKPRILDGTMYGLGAVDMKGPLACLLVTARQVGQAAPVMVVITTDEETSKAGAKALVSRSRMLAEDVPKAIVIAEPTGMVPVRAHRATVEFAVEAAGVQAHSATSLGRSAAWPLVDFLQRMNEYRELIRERMVDPDFDPPVCDVAVKLFGTGNALNVTASRAAARLAWRYSASVDPAPVIEAVRRAASETGLTLATHRHGKPLHLDRCHPLVRLAEGICGREAETKSFSTDASELQAVAPCLILGPGSIETAHTPGECVRIDDLVASVPLFRELATAIAAGQGWH